MLIFKNHTISMEPIPFNGCKPFHSNCNEIIYVYKIEGEFAKSAYLKPHLTTIDQCENYILTSIASREI